MCAVPWGNVGQEGLLEVLGIAQWFRDGVLEANDVFRRLFLLTNRE